MQLQEVTIVVAADNYDPFLVNDFFLRSQRIIPPEFNLLSEGKICSAQLSRLAYEQRFALEMQQRRLSLIEAGDDYAKFAIPDIATKLVDALPGLRYQAVGINPTAVVPCGSKFPRQAFNAFIKKGDWTKNKGSSNLAGFAIAYEYEHKRLTLEIGSASYMGGTGEQQQAISFRGNFHYELQAYTVTEQAV